MAEALPYNERPCQMCGKPYKQGSGVWWGFCETCGYLETFYDPLPAQRAFHSSPAKYRLYAGGFGSGKTLCGCQEVNALALRYPGNFILVGAQTYTNLRDTTLQTFLEIVPTPVLKGGKLEIAFNKTEMSITYQNGTVVIFRSMDEPNKYKSLNLGAFYIDELSEVAEEIWLMLESRLRRNTVPRRTGFATTNPERGWVYSRFIQNQGKNPDYAYFQAPTTENIYLPEDYVQGLLNSYPESWVKRYIYADWTAFEGQVYPDFQPTYPYVVPHEEPDPDWPVYVGIDHGLHNPTAAVWAARNPKDGSLYVFQEYYQKNQLVEHHAKHIKFMSDKYPVYAYWIDPSTQNRNAVTGKSVLSEYRQHGVPVLPGNNDLMAGIHKVSEYLKRKPDGQPRLIISERCVNLIEELSQYRWEDPKPGRNEPEKPHPYKDHSCFVAGTLIETENGPKPIETIKIGERVLTRQGYQPVLDAAQTYCEADVYMVKFSNNTSLIGTGDHPIWIKNKGWVNLSQLCEGDEVIHLCEVKPLFTKESNSVGTPIQTDVLIEYISPLPPATENVELDDYMKKSGKTLMAKYRKATTSITKTGTLLIMISRIWNAFRLKNIYLNTPPILKESQNLWRILKKLVAKLLNGTGLKLAVLGTENMGNVLGLTENLLLKSVPNAESRFRPLTESQPQDSVIKTAKCVRVESVSKLPEKQPVYNLTVDVAHEYFANGILVSNCDALRYLCMGVPKFTLDKPVAMGYTPPPIPDFYDDGEEDIDRVQVYSGLV